MLLALGWRGVDKLTFLSWWVRCCSCCDIKGARRPAVPRDFAPASRRQTPGSKDAYEGALRQRRNEGGMARICLALLTCFNICCMSFLVLGRQKKQGDNGTRGRESACRSGRCRREEANMLPANQNHQRRPETFPAYQKGDELLAAKKEASLVMGAKSRCIACCICSEEVAEALVGKTRGSLSIKFFFSLVVGETF